jgi:hypothetical protein
MRKTVLRAQGTCFSMKVMGTARPGLNQINPLFVVYIKISAFLEGRWIVLAYN